MRNKFWLPVLTVVGALVLAGCTQVEKVFYTVAFDTNGGNEIASVEVAKGRSITQTIADPVIDDAHIFMGWFEDNETFLNEFVLAHDVVTQDMTLYAKWRILQSYPTEIGMYTMEAYSNKILWVQDGVTSGYAFEVTLFKLVGDTYDTEGTVYPGTFEILVGSQILWTPDVAPTGGTYKASVATYLGATLLSTVEVEGLLFKGAGLLTNPYLVNEAVDLYGITKAQTAIGSGKFYILTADITIETVYLEAVGTEFQGDFNGASHIITVTTGNTSIFEKLGIVGTIHDLTIAGTLTTGTTAGIAGLVTVNAGTIQNVINQIAVTSTAGTVGDATTKDISGAAGIAGNNETTGTISNCSNEATIKAKVGGGGIVGQNKGVIEDCRNAGTMGAGNAVESSKSLSAYSYMGGIAGFNEGTIRRSETTSTGKLLAQRYTTSTPTDTSNNRVIGGIAGYNMTGAIIEQSFFSGIRCMGDQYVGGIAGINAGAISNSYSAGLYYTTPLVRSYIGARLNVGGIAGLLEAGGTITNCFNTANIYSFTSGDSPFGIASEATNCVSITDNLDPRSTGTQTYGNTITDTLVAPSGSGNVMVPSTSMSGTELDYVLAD
ncbi:MAG: InlB B-repeat-containing protein, partial [Firmicutes bacterium]|nr:InlB B-repeat-containing protein [Bacillota bacterium]